MDIKVEYQRLRAIQQQGQLGTTVSYTDFANMLDTLIHAILSNVSSTATIRLDGKDYTTYEFIQFLYTQFFEGIDITTIPFTVVKQYVQGMNVQETLEGKQSFRFEANEQKREKQKRIEYAPSQHNLFGETAEKKESVVRQQYIQNIVNEFSNIPELYEHQNIALDAIAQYKKLSVQLPTGSGKTLVAIEAIRRFGDNKPVLIIVPTILLLDQWKAALQKYGVNATAVYADEKKWGIITIITYASALRHLPDLAQFNMVVMDEVHHVYGEELRNILYRIAGTAEYIIGLSATAKQSFESGYKLQESIIPTKVEMLPASMKGTKFEVPLEIIREPITLNFDERSNYDYDTQVMRNALRKLGAPGNWAKSVNDEDIKISKLARAAIMAMNDRRKILSESKAKITKALEIINDLDSIPILVFTETIDSANALKKLLDAQNIKAETIHYRMGLSVIEKRDILNKFKNGKLRVLIGVISIEEGIDIPEVATAIWIGSSRISQRYLVQRVGRILRPMPGKTAKLYYIYAVGTIESNVLQSLDYVTGNEEI